MKIAAGLIAFSFVISAAAEDWPTYGHDNRRSHVTSEVLTAPLVETWIYQSPQPPQPAWTAPAKWDAFAANDGLQSMRNFDPAFFVTASGDKVYFGSSVDNAAHCLHADSGEEIWVAFADGPVRLPPTIQGDRAWFGSDDGFVYCVNSENGEEVWRQRCAPESRLIPSNGKLISPWPVRTGVLVEGNAAYFASSLFPWEKSYLVSVGAGTGSQRYTEELENVTLQGALLASSGRLYAPQGRSLPLVFAMETGSRAGDVPGTGGVWCILTEREELISGPQNQKDKEPVVKLTNPASRESILSISGATRMIAAGNRIYFHQRGQLKAVDRERPNENLWAQKAPAPASLILAGEHLYLGGLDSVAMIDAESGNQLWNAEIKGRAYGLAVANGRLFVSTDHGFIYAFEAAQID
ncbi:MAG: PQQ-binding-like beta-propeller repeat protein [Verrucomicrobiota bacterium]